MTIILSEDQIQMSITSSTNDTDEIDLWSMSYDMPQIPNLDVLVSVETYNIQEMPTTVRTSPVIPMPREAFAIPTIRRAPQTASGRKPFAEWNRQ
jgi:hypothetical protein